MGALIASNAALLLNTEQAPSPVVDQEGRTLIDFFLNDQKQLNAIEKFSLLHDAGTPPQHQQYYRDLIPLSAPAPGQQYAFEVDLDACSGCKACVTACHSMNGLDEDEVWRSVGLLQGGDERAPIFQMVTSACHHCAHPACMLGCPVKAYAKDEFTGIVKHLDDQCIGCQYCVLKCPYDVPKYNPRRGIVRKCDMCSTRLAAQEAPACVQACPSTAIKITLVDKLEVAALAKDNKFLPGVPAPEYTQPTTRYKRRTALPLNTAAADAHRVTPEHAHWPLVVMLVLTQLSVGAFAFEALSKLFGSELDAAARPLFLAAAFATGFVGLNSALFHLGRPLYAFRAVLGFRTSWMSREIVAFGAYLAASSAYATSAWAPRFGSHVPGSIVLTAQAMTIVSGVLGVICSAMIYIDTRREFWRASQTAVKFTLTTLLLGLAAFTVIAAGSSTQAGIKPLCIALALTAIFKMGYETRIFSHLNGIEPCGPLSSSALLMKRSLASTVRWRFLLGAAGGLLPVLITIDAGIPRAVALAAACASLAFLVVSELLERSLFFRAVVALKMPGGAAA